MKLMREQSRATWLMVAVLVLMLAMPVAAFGRLDRFGGAVYVEPYAPYTAGPVVPQADTRPYAPYTAGPVVREDFRPYAPYTAGPVVKELRSEESHTRFLK